MKYLVTAIGVDVEGNILSRRCEWIDASTDGVFKGCRGPWDVEDRYEAFWNRLTREGSTKERVKVLRVEPEPSPRA